MSCKVKCLYYSEECGEYCKYAKILSSELIYIKEPLQGIYLDEEEVYSGTIYD